MRFPHTLSEIRTSAGFRAKPVSACVDDNVPGVTIDQGLRPRTLPAAAVTATSRFPDLPGWRRGSLSFVTGWPGGGQYRSVAATVSPAP